MWNKTIQHSLQILVLFFTLQTLNAQTPKSKIDITHLTGDFYVYTTYNRFQDIVFPANGMYVLSTEGVILLDSPWDTTQFQPLLDSIKQKHHQNVVLCIATHAHEDRTAGLTFLRERGIKTYTTHKTDSICQLRNEKRAEFLIQKDTVFTIGQHRFQTLYAGPGHTEDNIVVWFEQEKILYGGCLIKSTEARDLGNLVDANTKAWPNTIKKIQVQCKQPQYIIPGHQDWSSKKALEHTLKLLEQHAKSNKP